MMHEAIFYSGRMALCLMAFFLAYKALLSRATFHRFNRWALLAVMALSAVLPAIRLTIPVYQTAAEGMVGIGPMVAAEAEMMPPNAVAAIDPLTIVQTIYLAGMVLMALRLAWQLLMLRRVLRRGEVVETIGRVRVMVADIPPSANHGSRQREEKAANALMPSFSWFRTIVMSHHDYEQNRRTILAHELAHARKWHSADILLADVLLIVQWFNPAAWLLRHELQDVHEFEADEAVVNEGIEPRQYQMLLIQKAVGERMFALANHFQHQSLKRRIRMMTTRKTNRWHRARALAAVPMAGLALMAFARQEVVTVPAGTTVQNAKVEMPAFSAEKSRPADRAVVIAQNLPGIESDTLEMAPVAGEKAYDVVEQMPQFPGGITNLIKWVGENMRYPEEAMNKNIEGRVIVTFVVERDGSVNEAKVMRSIDPLLDAEALRVVNAMPQWEPGRQNGEAVRVKYTMPLNFKLQGNDDESKAIPANGTPRLDVGDGKALVGVKGNLAYVADGKTITEAEMKAIAPERIASITVSKDDETKQLYHCTDKDAVILITMK